MSLVRSAAELPDALAATRRTARSAFGDDTLLVERFIEQPRHIEIQVLADAHGTVLHLGERECSLQRRHQKIIEESPSPLLDPARREAMGRAAIEAARSVGYVGAGTVEFIVPGTPSGSRGGGGAEFEFFFMEMNTRLQVEHPVTELVYGLDLVELQLRVAAGEPLPSARPTCGCPATPWRPASTPRTRPAASCPPAAPCSRCASRRCLRRQWPPAVRVDSALTVGTLVGSSYDPMLAKVIAHGPDRAAALQRLDAALAEVAVLGVTTNVAFLRALLADPDVASGRARHRAGRADRIPRARVA